MNILNVLLYTPLSNEIYIFKYDHRHLAKYFFS